MVKNYLILDLGMKGDQGNPGPIGKIGESGLPGAMGLVGPKGKYFQLKTFRAISTY